MQLGAVNGYLYDNKEAGAILIPCAMVECIKK